MDVLPTQDTASITLLPRPYSNVVDIEKDLTPAVKSVQLNLGDFSYAA